MTVRFSGNQWTICVVSSDAGIKDWNYLILFALFGLIIMFFILRWTYSFFRESGAGQGKERYSEQRDLQGSADESVQPKFSGHPYP